MAFTRSAVRSRLAPPLPSIIQSDLVAAENADRGDLKKALAANYKTINYTVDKPDELVFSTVSDLGGNPIKGYGFSVIVTAGGKKVECGSSYDDEATAQRMEAVCKSLTKG